MFDWEHGITLHSMQGIRVSSPAEGECSWDFSGTLCSSMRQIKAPYLFDWEQGIALHAMQGNRPSSLSEQQVSWFFSSCGDNLGYILELQQGWPFETPLRSEKSGLLSS